MRLEISTSPCDARHAPMPRIAMIASWMPVHEIVHTTAAARAARMPCAAASRASATIRPVWRTSARLALTVRIARSAPSSVPPSRPTDSCAASCALAIRGISSDISVPTTSTAPIVHASSTRSRTPISTSVATIASELLMRPTRLDDASCSRPASEVTRVTSSPVGRPVN